MGLDEVLSRGDFVIMAEGIGDPGNLGSILRIAHAMGAVCILADCADVFAPKTVRASAGSIFHADFAQTSAAAAIDALCVADMRIFAADAKGAKALYNADFSGPAAIIIGNEAHGISPAALAAAHEKVCIPTAAESLNAAVACGILAYEVVRQRLEVRSQRSEVRKP